MNNNSAWTFYPDHVERWAYQHSVFTPDECDEIIKFGKSLGLSRGAVINDGKREYDSVRDSNIVFMYPDADFSMQWIWNRITDQVLRTNDAYFKFELFGFMEGLQFTEYVAPTGNYGAHIDKLYGGSVRKLSVVIQLSDPSEYDGGDFEVLDSDDPQKLHRNRGTLLAFPSYTVHRVTPVTRGTRYSLVGWISGPPFK